MAEEVGIVMTLYDRVSPTLKSIAGSSRAFDKSLDELEASLKAYDKAQTELVGHSANLKKAIAETDVKVREAQKSYRKLKDETSKARWTTPLTSRPGCGGDSATPRPPSRRNAPPTRPIQAGTERRASAISKADNRGGRRKERHRTGRTGKGADGSRGRKPLERRAGEGGGCFPEQRDPGEPEARMASSILSGAVSGGSMGAVLGAPRNRGGRCCGGPGRCGFRRRGDL